MPKNTTLKEVVSTKMQLKFKYRPNEMSTNCQNIVREYPSEVPPLLKVTLRQLPPKEKRPIAPLPPKQTPQQAQEDILAHIESVKEPRTKRVYSEIFMDAPSKKEYPEYYAYIQRVICLNEIKVVPYGVETDG